MKTCDSSLLASIWVFAALGVGCSTAGEPLGIGRERIASDAFFISCEPGFVVPDVATHGSVGLAAWKTSSSVHAARFDAEGNVSDAFALDLGLPDNLLGAGSTSPVGEVHVLEATSGFAVVLESDDCAPGGCFRRLRYRTVDANGALGASWGVVDSQESSGAAYATITYLGGGFDGAQTYVAHSHMVMTAGHPATNLFANAIGTTPSGSTASWESPVNGVYYSPVFYAFGCRPGACLFTYREATPSGLGSNKALILGQTAIDAPDSDVGDSLVGTASGFIQASVGTYTVAGTYSAPGTPTSAKIVLWGSTATTVAGHGLVFDGVEVRAIWADGTNLLSGTFSDSGVVSSLPNVETPNMSLPLGIAPFGAGRSVALTSPVNGVVGWFIGSIPASVPSGCPVPSGTSSSSASVGGAGGASAVASSASGGGSGGAIASSSSSTTGAGGATSSDGASTGATDASSSASGSGAGGGSTATSNDPSSSAADAGSNSSGAVTSGIAASSGVGGAEGGTANGGCAIVAAPSADSTELRWTSILIGVVIASAARGRRRRSASRG